MEFLMQAWLGTPIWFWLAFVGLVVATATACGGDGDSDSAAATTVAATAADPRAGYFGEDESAALNAPLAAFAAEEASGGLRTYADVVTRHAIDLRRPPRR